MTLEQLAPTLEICQQLKAVGFPQDTALCWFHYGHTEHWGLLTQEQAQNYARMNDDNDIAAPTAGELEEWLMTFGFGELLTNKNPGDPFPERLWMVLASIHKEEIVQHAYGSTHVAALASLVLEVAG